MTPAHSADRIAEIRYTQPVCIALLALCCCRDAGVS